MLIACWSSKGGSGTTVVAASLALLLARSSPDGALLVDLAGDIPAVLGVPEPDGPGLAEWLAAGADIGADALGRLERPARSDLALIARGEATLDHPDRGELLAALLAADPRPVVVDCGLIGADRGPAGEVACAIAATAVHSLLVLRCCYLALRRAAKAPVRPSGIVLLIEPGRTLDGDDVEGVLGVEVRAVLDIDREVFRTVDAGLLVSRLPRALERGLRDAA